MSGIRTGRILVTTDLLRDVLGLPESAILRGVIRDHRLGSFELLIDDESLPEVAEGAVIPLYDPMITNDGGSLKWDWRA